MISVCMATYNGEYYIKEQIDSILGQLGVNDELVISDDGSTDKTVKIIESYDDNRIKLFSHSITYQKKGKKPTNHHLVSSNFENALNNACNDIIFLSDQDDIWLPDKVNIMISHLQHYDLVISNFSIINSDGTILKETYFNNNPISKYLLFNIFKMPFWGCCIAFKRGILLKSLPFPANTIVHDNWIGILATLFGNVKYIDIPLIYYRRHVTNVSFDSGCSRNSYWFRVKYRVFFLLQLLKRICL